MLDSLANVKSRLGIITTDYDAFLTLQISLASDVIEAYCRRKFASASWVQTFYRQHITNPLRFELYHFPIINLTSVTIDGILMDDSDFQEILVHKPTGKLRRKDCGWIHGKEIGFLYTAGYATIPSPILAVLDDIVGQRYNKKITGVDLNFGSDVQQISIPGAISISFDYTLTNNDRTSSYGVIIGNNANILDDWRSERTVIGNDSLKYVEVSS